MKLIKCIIRPDKLPDVIGVLNKLVPAMTVAEVRGHGRQKGHPVIFRGIEYDVALMPKTMIEMVVDDNKVDDVIRAVVETATTGSIGDGRVFVQPVEETYHVRTGFMDLD